MESTIKYINSLSIEDSKIKSVKFNRSISEVESTMKPSLVDSLRRVDYIIDYSKLSPKAMKSFTNYVGLIKGRDLLDKRIKAFGEDEAIAEPKTDLMIENDGVVKGNKRVTKKAKMLTQSEIIGECMNSSFGTSFGSLILISKDVSDAFVLYLI